MQQTDDIRRIPLADSGRMRETELDEVFDTDYEYFMSSGHDPQFNGKEADLAIRAGRLEPGMRVLDAACGYGRIGLELARRGIDVHGVDRNPALVASARTRAGRESLPADFDTADLRELTAAGAYDAALVWFTSFGYGSDADSRVILANLCTALRPGGRLLLDILNPAQQRALSAGRPQLGLQRVGSDFMLDEVTYDVTRSRLESRRTVVRDHALRECRWSLRMLEPSELEQWLGEAGFVDVQFLGDDGHPFAPTHRRLLAVARTPGPRTAPDDRRR
ncbi:class I SAM-dependent methyltransferase [Streptomyces platensis]|uniref:Class I SAM-dependent methyltransferase n=2 Tax=Streptomyces platensis TaxID=58346 RepID=A0AAE6TLE7_STRPT|nr:class I SAM-dependent methyltransferase [Streptomyces platensis]QEV51691.1 class I SAM-dependent methyltransferase [Streptomyces platensis]